MYDNKNGYCEDSKMAKIREVKILSMQEAMDNLAAVVGIDLENPPRMGIIQRHRLVTDADAVGPHEIVWLSGEGSEGILEILDMTFYTIHRHLVSMLESSEINWDDPKVLKGVEAMVALSADAAMKMDRYLAFRLDKELTQKVEERPSYQELHFFYHNRFVKRLKKSDKEIWSEDWEKNEESSLLDLSKTGLKDFETVKRDLQYELFSIRNETGKAYFNPGLLRNIKLACFDIGKAVSFEEDPLLRVRAMEDRDLQASARQILIACDTVIADFYKAAKRLKEITLAQYLSESLMALFLAANPRNLIQNTSGKSSLSYFHDFQMYLRLAMNSDEYQKYIAYPEEAGDKTAELLLHLTHALSQAFFYRLGGVRQEAIGLIHRCMRKGEEADRKTSLKGDTIWNRLLIDDEKFRSLLTLFPNGPLFKILDLIREEEPESMVFDPLLQNNLPQKVFEITGPSKTIHVIRTACPTRQALIHKAMIVEEFRGLLRAYASVRPHKKHLMINLQDRTSWQELSRCQGIEKLQNNAEFSGQLAVVSLPKNTDFYHQISEYMNSNDAKDFIAQFKGQLSSPEECGFFLPAVLSGKEWTQFIERSLSFIHEQMFDGSSTLTRRNREDFIEIFYQLLVLKCIELIQPDSISFSCKDAIDTGAGALASFFGFLQILSGEMEKEVDFLRWLLYTPALFIRERAVDPERLNRAISCLEKIDEALGDRGAKLQKALGDLYHPKFLKALKIKKT